MRGEERRISESIGFGLVRGRWRGGGGGGEETSQSDEGSVGRVGHEVMV